METVRLSVRLTPRASRDAIAGFEGETLRVRVTAPPVEGRANRALVRLLAKRLGLPRGAVRVVTGADLAQQGRRHRRPRCDGAAPAPRGCLSQRRGIQREEADR